MKHYTFNSLEELKGFIEERREEKRELFYYGDIECMDGHLYTIEDIERDAVTPWFENGSEADVYEFELETIYGVGETSVGLEEYTVCASKEEAVETANRYWNQLCDYDKKRWEVYAAVLYVRYYEDKRFLTEDMGIDEDEIDMEHLTEEQKSLILSSRVDEFLWKSEEA